MSKRAQARVMALFAERQEKPAAPVSRRQSSRFEQWMEEWYYDGACAGYHWSRTSCEFLASRLHRRLRALKMMSDRQYIEMRQTRCFDRYELESEQVDGVLYSARALKIRETRESLRDLESRLAIVVRALPQRHGYSVDQDEFNLRGYGRWYVNCRFASYLSFEKRLRLYKEMRAIERAHEERYRMQRRAERRAEKYPELVRRIRELEARLT